MVLIVAECNVNDSKLICLDRDTCVLIVAECNVNGGVRIKPFIYKNVLIVAECNVNLRSRTFRTLQAQF